MDVVCAVASAAAPGSGRVDHGPALKNAIDELAVKAQQKGCNGVIWIRFDRERNGVFGMEILATGTAVRVK